MKLYFSILLSACACTLSAQELVGIDSTDVFFRHIELKEVVVTGPTGAVKMEDLSMPAAVIDRNALRMAAASNIVDAVSKLPGVSQITTGCGISKPVIRGLGYNRVVVVADGVRQEGQQWGDEHGLEIDANSVSSVEVLKGPASLLYGSDALAGVVKLNTDPVVPYGKMRLNVSTEYQTNNGLFNYSLNYGGNKRGLSWNVRYGDKMAHAYKAPRDGYVPNTQFRERALSGMLGVNKAWGHTRLIGSYFHLTPSIAEGERDAETGVLIQPYSNAKTYHHGVPFQQVYHYKAVLDNAFHLGGGKLNAVFAYQQNRRQEYEEPDEYGLYLKLHTVNYNVHYVTPMLGDWRITTGVNGMWQRSLNQGDEFLIPDYRLFDFGVFATTTANVGNFALNGGIRFDNRSLNSHSLIDDGEVRFEAFKRKFNGFTASIGAVWHATSGLDLRVNAARGFRAPNISELASNGVHEGSLRYEVGNSELKPEFSMQFDFGVDYSNAWLGAQLSLFSNRINNYIFIHRTEQVIDPEYMTYRYDSGDAQLLGGEVAIDIHPWHFLHLGTSFAMVNAVQLHQPADSKYLPFTPAPRWQTDVKWEIMHDARGMFNNAFVSVGVDYNFKQNHYYCADNTETATPAYCLLNATIGTDIMYRGRRVACLSIAGTNLTNKAYQNHLSRLKYTEVNPVTGLQGVNNMGRNIVFKLAFPLEF